MMHDLKKLEEKFHEFLTDGLKEGTYDKNKHDMPNYVDRWA